MAAGIDGTSVVFAGSTYGSWAEDINAGDGHKDFAGMAMDADKNVLWTYQVLTQMGCEIFSPPPTPSPLLLSTSGETGILNTTVQWVLLKSCARTTYKT